MVVLPKAAQFPFPTLMVLRLAAAGILGRKRSLRKDSTDALRSAPAIHLEGCEHIPASGPFLIVINHYNYPGIGIWWPVMALSTALPADPHWVMTAAWTFSGWLKQHTLGPLSAWAFARVAKVYGFTGMPIMPPRDDELVKRAAAVRQVILHARSHPSAVIAMSPEGHNTPDLNLGWPPAGTGRFMWEIAKNLKLVIPAGIALENSGLTVRFGKPFELSELAGTPRGEVDRQASRLVMEHISRVLPERMRGEFHFADLDEGNDPSDNHNGGQR